MKKHLVTLWLCLALSLVCRAQSRFDIPSQLKGTVPVANGGTGNTSPGTNGQVLICDGISACAPGDPIVSYNYVNLLNAAVATTTATGAAVRNSMFSTSGNLYVTFASITGSPATCTIQLKNIDSQGNSINNGPALAVTVANGTKSFSVVPLPALRAAGQMSATFNCGTFPTAGTITVDFSPSFSTFTAFGIPGITGCYAINGRTANYAGQAAGTELWAMRWGSATSVGIVLKISANVETTTAATVTGPAERELIGTTSGTCTAADTGGTAVTLTGSQLDPAYPTSALTDMRFGNGTLTAGTRTLNSNPFASVISWLPLLMTGVDIGGACGDAHSGTSVAWTCQGGMGPIELWNATNNQNHPIVLRQNSCLYVRIGKDNQPTTAAQRTMINAMWCEAPQYSAN
jgi:hypothetical protein